MNRREFIKNSLLICGCSYLAIQGKNFYDFNYNEFKRDEIPLKKSYLIEQYKDKSELPKKIRLEACTLCQLNCPCCWMRLHPKEIEKNGGLGYLKFKDFKKLIDDNNFEEIELSNDGEIFLNPELLDIIKYSYKKNISLTAYTGVNLNYLTDQMAEALVKYQYRNLIVSIDGASPSTYAIYRRGGDFNTVIKNIKKINYFKEKYNSHYPELSYKFIVFGHNEHEIDKVKKLAKKLNMNMVFEANDDQTYSPVKNVELVKKKTGINPINPDCDEIVKTYAKDHSHWLFCKSLWQSPQINWDGKVLGCCCNYNSNFGGNVFKEGLLKALNNAKMIYAKNILANNAKPIPGIPCTDCYNYTLLKKMNVTVKPKQRGNNLVI